MSSTRKNVENSDLEIRLPRLISAPAAASYCGVSAKTFSSQVRPFVPPICFGGRRLWDIRQLDAYIDQLSGTASQQFEDSENAYEKRQRRKRKAKGSA